MWANMTWLFYPLLTTALYYLLAHSQVLGTLHDYYPDWLDRFLSCPACSGFWYGAFVSMILGNSMRLGFCGLEWNNPATHIVVGLCSIVWTPILARAHIDAMLYMESGENAGEPEKDED